MSPRPAAGGDAAAFRRLGAVCRRQKKFAHAIAAYRQAVALDPDDGAAQRGLARALAGNGDVADAIAVVRGIVARQGSSPELLFELAALTGLEPPAAAPRGFVVKLFDAYAARFDTHLVERLKYRAPQLLFDAVAALAPPPAPWDILDLGCGTGLCGAVFRPLARSLTGVDLSPGMIAKAREHAIYDRLIVDDLAALMAAEPARFDLILAADVLVYVGDLAAAFGAARDALRPAGLFVFSVETHDGDGFVLGRARRFAHSLSYLERAAAAADFELLRATTETLRLEGRREVRGHVVVLRRLRTRSGR